MVHREWLLLPLSPTSIHTFSRSEKKNSSPSDKTNQSATHLWDNLFHHTYNHHEINQQNVYWLQTATTTLVHQLE
jgi:hypothetical protein